MKKTNKKKEYVPRSLHLKDKSVDYFKKNIMTNSISHEITGVVCLIIAAALFLSFVSMNPSDSPLLSTETTTEIKNLLGFFGSSVSSFSFMIIGLSSYIIVAFFIWFGINSIARSASKSYLGIIIMSAAAIFIISSLFDLIMPYSAPIYNKGGILGKGVASFLNTFFGTIGSFMFLMALSIVVVLSSGFLSIKESIENIRHLFSTLFKNEKESKNRKENAGHLQSGAAIGGVKKVFPNETNVVMKKKVTPLQYKIMPVIEKIEVPYIKENKIENTDIKTKIKTSTEPPIEEDTAKKDIPIYTSDPKDEKKEIENEYIKMPFPSSKEANEIAEIMRMKIITNTKIKSYLNKHHTDEKINKDFVNKTDIDENEENNENENTEKNPLQKMGYAKYKPYNRLDHFGINSRIAICEKTETEENNSPEMPEMKMGYAKYKPYSREEHFGINTKKYQSGGENQNNTDDFSKEHNVFNEENEEEYNVNAINDIENIKENISDEYNRENHGVKTDNSFEGDSIEKETIVLSKKGNFDNLENEDYEKKESIEINIDRAPKTLEKKVIRQKKDFFIGDYIQTNFDKDFVDKHYRKPLIDLLKRSIAINDEQVNEAIRQTAARLENTLLDFGVEARVVSVSRGPVITRYELELASGTRVSKIVGLTDNIALALASESVRIIAPIPGRSVIGIEIPNRVRAAVYLRDVLESSDFHNNKHELPFVIGKGIYGNNVVTDLTDAPHLLVAGTTGSGKSVCLSTIILSLLYKFRPDELKFIFIDKKRVELSIYNGIPHLMAPVVSDEKKATVVLKHIVDIMEARYERMEKFFVRNVKAYNEKVKKLMDDGENEFEGEPLELFPYIVLVIDELHNLMVVASKEVEDLISRLAGMSRAVGIHLIIATQRPSADVITGVIKANLPTRIAFQVPNKTNSRIIIDMSGAEQLLGKGDGLFCSTGSQMPERVQGAFVSDPEVKKVVDYLSAQMEPMYDKNLIASLEKGDSEERNIEEDIMDEELWDEAIQVVMRTRKASASFLQRKLKIGYNRAARIVELMEQQGYVGKENGSKPREVYIASEY